MSKRKPSAPHSTVTVRQLDGTLIDAAACTCPPLFVRYPDIGSVDCPVDAHRVKWFISNWEFDDNGEIFVDVVEDEAW